MTTFQKSCIITSVKWLRALQVGKQTLNKGGKQMPIYINKIKASAEDIKALFENVRQKKDRIKRLTVCYGQIRIYTV